MKIFVFEPNLFENIENLSTLKKKNLVISDIGKRVGVVGAEQLKLLPCNCFSQKQ
jgi:hypothetical protein